MNSSDAQLLQRSPAVESFLSRSHCGFAEGLPVAGSADAGIAVHDPANGKVLTHVAESTEADVDRAVVGAHAAFHDGRWSRLRPAERERILLRFADAFEAHAEELAQLETLEQGKSIHIARAIDIGATLEYLRYVAGLATKVTGQTLDVSIPFPPGANYFAYTRREPVGVVAGIAPWNFPLMIAMWKIAPALASGCSIVLKPSEFTPLTALRIAEIAVGAGVPPGVFNVVTGRGAQVGQALVSHPLIAKITFTGSSAVGRQVGKLAMDNMTRLSLELGGKNPAIFLKDVDLASAIPGAVGAAFLNQGQVCAAPSRFYIEAPIFDRFVAGLSDAIAAMRLGPGMDLAATLNPVASKPHQLRIADYLDDARRNGAELIEGASPPDADGYYVRPTLVIDPPAGARLAHAEVFGPVLSLHKVDSAVEAIEAANATAFGLTASVWTKDLPLALSTVAALRAGTVWVNTHNVIDPAMPFGGMKQSGMGRDFGNAALDAYTEVKAICMAT